MKYKTQLSLDVDITFDVLSPIIVDGQKLPAMIEITGVKVDSTKKSRGRKVDLLNSLSEEQLMLLEDDILENYGKEP
jgi:hypothetical protein